jgi:hypothetical protein
MIPRNYSLLGREVNQTALVEILESPLNNTILIFRIRSSLILIGGTIRTG